MPTRLWGKIRGVCVRCSRVRTAATSFWPTPFIDRCLRTRFESGTRPVHAEALQYRYRLQTEAVVASLSRRFPQQPASERSSKSLKRMPNGVAEVPNGCQCEHAQLSRRSTSYEGIAPGAWSLREKPR